jgi:hypothetical protein
MVEMWVVLLRYVLLYTYFFVALTWGWFMLWVDVTLLNYRIFAINYLAIAFILANAYICMIP